MWRIGGLRLYCGTVSSNSTASAVGAKVGATDGNDGKHTKGGVDYDRRNLIRDGSVVGSGHCYNN